MLPRFRGLARIALALLFLAAPLVAPNAAAEAGPLGAEPYRRACAECHNKGKSKRPDGRGAPRLGDARAWESRIAKGPESIYKKLLNEPHGRDVPEDKKSEWRGGLGDAEIRDVLDYMLEQLP
jgi:cytochrome c5